MDEEQKLIKQRDLGLQAQALLKDELLTAIFEGLRAQYMKEWAQTKPEEGQLREHWWLQLHALLDVRGQINAIFNNGKTATTFLAAHRAKAAA